MGGNRAIRLLLALTFSAMSVGCSKGVTHVEGPEIDLSRLPPEQLVLELARRGDLDNLRACVEADPRLVHVRGGYDETPLHVAAENGHAEVAAYLLARGADASALNANADTPAVAARRRGHDRVAVLIDGPRTGGDS